MQFQRRIRQSKRLFYESKRPNDWWNFVAEHWRIKDKKKRIKTEIENTKGTYIIENNYNTKNAVRNKWEYDKSWYYNWTGKSFSNSKKNCFWNPLETVLKTK